MQANCRHNSNSRKEKRPSRTQIQDISKKPGSEREGYGNSDTTEEHRHDDMCFEVVAFKVGSCSEYRINGVCEQTPDHQVCHSNDSQQFN